MKSDSDGLVGRLSQLPPGRSITGADRLARNLGWMSLALGAVELFAAPRVTKALGIAGREGLVRLYGVREIGAGIGALSVSKGTGMRARVAGDALDLVTLGTLLPSSRRRGTMLVAIGVVGAIAAVDWLCVQALSRRERKADQPVKDYSDRSGLRITRNTTSGNGHADVPTSSISREALLESSRGSGALAASSRA